MKGGTRMNVLQQKGKSANLQKTLLISGLYAAAGIIALSGLLFIVYSQLNGISFKVMNTSVPGMVFGLLISYFGIKGLFSVKKLNTEINKTNARFSWDNFKKAKSR